MEFSLGASALGFPEADGCRTPTLGPPGPFLLAFKPHAQSDAAVIRGLFTACRSGRDLAAELAQRLTVCLDTDQAVSPSWPSKLAAAEAALTSRGNLPSRLQIECGGDHGDQGLREVLYLLHTAGGGITELEIIACGANPALTEFLNQAAHELNGLRSLSIGPCPQDCALPVPAQYPNLTSLSLNITQDEDHHQGLATILRTAAAYLPHVTTLSATFDLHEPDWTLFFTHAVSTSTPTPPHYHTSAAPYLTHLTVSDTLRDDLAALLVTHAPTLAVLSVSLSNSQANTGTGNGH